MLKVRSKRGTLSGIVVALVLVGMLVLPLLAEAQEDEPPPGAVTGDQVQQPPVEEHAAKEPASSDPAGTKPPSATTSAEPAEPELAIPWLFLLAVVGFGAAGGLAYELTTLQGNFEWPHVSTPEETAKKDLPYAGPRFLLDLGGLARLFVGSVAALTVFWVLPPQSGLKLVAVCLVAGFSGSALMTSLQSRLLALLNGAKVEQQRIEIGEVKKLYKELVSEVRAPSGSSAQIRSSVGKEESEGAEPDLGGADWNQKAAEIEGRLNALLKIRAG